MVIKYYGTLPYKQVKHSKTSVRPTNIRTVLFPIPGMLFKRVKTSWCTFLTKTINLSSKVFNSFCTSFKLRLENSPLLYSDFLKQLLRVICI